MKPDKIPDVVNLPELTPEKTKKHNGDKPLTLTKAELKERRSMKPGEVKFYRPEQRPEFKKSVHRKRECPICGNNFRGKLKAVCPRCNNCMACGSFTGQNTDRICRICGNYDSGKREVVPTIIVN